MIERYNAKESVVGSDCELPEDGRGPAGAVPVLRMGQTLVVRLLLVVDVEVGRGDRSKGGIQIFCVNKGMFSISDRYCTETP